MQRDIGPKGDTVMAIHDFLPDREAELITWIGVFKALIASNYALYGLTLSQAEQYAVLADAFVSAHTLANADATRSPANIMAKNTMKKACVAMTRQLNAIIQKFPGTTDEMRTQLGLSIRRPGSPIGVPTSAPSAQVCRRSGTMVRYRVRDSQGVGSKPAGVAGAYVRTFVGPVAPVKMTDWVFQGQANRQYMDIVFPADTAPGTVVWFTAQWVNPRGQPGPGCAPVGAFIAGGSIMQTA
jgi:hypothetical protein